MEIERSRAFTTATQGGAALSTTQDTRDFRHGDGKGEMPPRLGIGRSIRPGETVARTVLVSNMGNGALYLGGWQEGPSAYLSPEDAEPLRRELAKPSGMRIGSLRMMMRIARYADLDVTLGIYAHTDLDAMCEALDSIESDDL
ncbi:MAG: hypothetical protein ACT4NY_13780 [Pseudonocardiales bacterium]